MRRQEVQVVAGPTIDTAEIGAADSDRICQHRHEHRLQLARRRTDDTQHLRCCGLLLQGLPQFIEQPRILNGDDGLIGEGLEKRNLLIRKRFNFGTSNLDCSNRHSLAQQWNTSHRPMSLPLRHGASFGKFLGLRLEIKYVDRPPLENGAACNTPTRARETNADFSRNRTPVGGRTQVLPVELENRHVVCFAEARRTPDDNLQHGLEFGRRSADDFENLRCRRPLFQRLVSSRVSRATSVSWPAADELRRRTAFGALRRFRATVLRRRVLTGSPPALERRLIAFPSAQDEAS